MRAYKRLNIKNVHFLGLRSNPYKYMKMADWLLSSSIFEGYSLVSQEAALLDTPLILTDCSGVRELLGDSEYGIVMEPSVIGIYNGMKKVMDNPELNQYYRDRIIERKKIIDKEVRFKEIEDMLFND
jgi:glycosyltransferase involved in cell wall biosynthesis